jgi:hypothetical protein
LLSVGQLFNEGYSVTFKIDGVTIINNQYKTILKGQRDAGIGLWIINLHSEAPSPQLDEANNVYEFGAMDARQQSPKQ